MATRPTTTTFMLHEPVALAIEKDGHPQGTAGAVVDAYPGVDSYTVELFDAEGETLDLVVCLWNELRKRTAPVNGRPQ